MSEHTQSRINDLIQRSAHPPKKTAKKTKVDNPISPLSMCDDPAVGRPCESTRWRSCIPSPKMPLLFPLCPLSLPKKCKVSWGQGPWTRVRSLRRSALDRHREMTQLRWVFRRGPETAKLRERACPAGESLGCVSRVCERFAVGFVFLCFCLFFLCL